MKKIKKFQKKKKKKKNESTFQRVIHKTNNKIQE